MILTWAAVAVVLSAIVAIWLGSRGSQPLESAVTQQTSPANEQPTTSATAPPSTIAPAVVVPTFPTGTVAPLPPVVATIAPTIAPATTATPAPTVPAVTTTIVAAATTLPPSGPAPNPALGSPQVLNDPLPSGLTADAVAPSFAVAQRLADALATEDWNTARRLDPEAAANTDQTFQVGYRGLDRASLMLLDARKEGEGVRLLFVSVANELDGKQTSLYCLEWSSYAGVGTIDQHAGAVGLLSRTSSTLSAEQVRGDPSLDSLVRTKCHWSSGR
jgi:hypothetical protein